MLLGSRSRTHLSPAIAPPSSIRIRTFGAIANLYILETHLRQCRILRQFHQIHAQMMVSSFMKDAFASSRLLLFSATSDFIDLCYSFRLFHHIDRPNAFMWNTVMRASVHKNHPRSSLDLYKSMLERDMVPDNYTHPILLHASAVRLLEIEGKQIHAHVSKFGFDSDVYATNTLINMYAVCGNAFHARQVFDTSSVKDSVSWNSILATYVEAGNVDEASEIFERMQDRNTIAANSMIALFGRRCMVVHARKLFDGMRTRDIISWTAMISCYEQNGMFKESVEFFSRMRNHGLPVDEVAAISCLSACARLGALSHGELVHALVLRTGLADYLNLQNSLIFMYSGCGDIVAARQLFDLGTHLDQISWNSMISSYLKCTQVDSARQLFVEMPQKDVVSWSTMIAGYAQNDRFSEALELFHEMQAMEIQPDETTLVSVICACARLSALEQGKWIHAYIKKHNYGVNVFLGTSLIDMYMKCGCKDSAMDVFHGMNERSVSTWNAIIVGLAMNGHMEDSLQKFFEMEECGVMPNEITFVAVLGACRHSCLVEEGRRLFHSMIEVYRIQPNVRHYGCMVDLLGRAGLLREAEVVLESMPMAPDVTTLGALLGACKTHGETEIGKRLGKRLIEIDPEHDGFHVLLSNIYASKGMWDHLLDLRGTMRDRGVVKLPGCSVVEHNGEVHEFLAGGGAGHPQLKQIEDMLEEIACRVKMDGYDPRTAEVAFDIDEEEKETAVWRHSEKIAMAFGLINVESPAPVRIVKNLRICSDCHAVAKHVSGCFAREIVVRDRHRFHHFRGGLCSCRDFW